MLCFLRSESLGSSWAYSLLRARDTVKKNSVLLFNSEGVIGSNAHEELGANAGHSSSAIVSLLAGLFSILQCQQAIPIHRHGHSYGSYL